jgi:hypothetical protein
MQKGCFKDIAYLNTSRQSCEHIDRDGATHVIPAKSEREISRKEPLCLRYHFSDFCQRHFAHGSLKTVAVGVGASAVTVTVKCLVLGGGMAGQLSSRGYPEGLFHREEG